MGIGRRLTHPVTFWHSHGRLLDGRKFSKLGAMSYIVDDEGNPISKGYHDIDIIIPGLKYIGYVGALKEVFYLDDADISPDDKTDILPDDLFKME